MNTSSPFALAAGLCVMLFAVPGCDSDKDTSGEAKSAAAGPKDGNNDGGKPAAKNDTPAKKAEPEAKPEPKPDPKPDVVACDQRDFIPEGEKKMAAAMGKEPKPKFVCMDYSGRTGGMGKPSCMQGTALPTPCPDDKVIATCTMSNGTVYKHYDGGNLNSAKRSCKTLEGTFAKS